MIDGHSRLFLRAPSFVHNVKEGPGGCWLWTAGKDAAGYGKAYAEKRYHMAHRLAYEAYRGPIGEGLELDHLCRVRACCNPAHLEPVTHQENTRRGLAGIPQRLAGIARTTCRKGHNIEPGNPNRGKAGRCKQCAHDLYLSKRQLKGLILPLTCKHGHPIRQQPELIARNVNGPYCLACSANDRFKLSQDNILSAGLFAEHLRHFPEGATSKAIAERAGVPPNSAAQLLKFAADNGQTSILRPGSRKRAAVYQWLEPCKRSHLSEADRDRFVESVIAQRMRCG